MRVKCALEHAVTSIAYLISFSMHIALITAPFQVRANERETWNSWNEMNLSVNGRIMLISHLSRPSHLFSDCHTLNECIILQHWQNDWNGEDEKKDEHRVHVCGRRRESAVCWCSVISAFVSSGCCVFCGFKTVWWALRTNDLWRFHVNVCN